MAIWTEGRELMSDEPETTFHAMLPGEHGEDVFVAENHGMPLRIVTRPHPYADATVRPATYDECSSWAWRRRI